MAREMRVVLTDDIDGSAAAETVVFGLDQFSYEIELSNANAEGLRKALAPYIAKARKTSSSPRPVRRSAKSKAPGYMEGLDTADVRAWAKENDYNVSDRGRIPMNVVEAYREAH